MHPTTDQAPPFSHWVAANGGLASLLSEAAAGRPLQGGMRLVAAPNGAVLAVARVCECGPENVVATVHDWVGGFRVTFAAASGGTAAMLPIAAEASVVAALRAIGEKLEERGLPMPFMTFVPGGAKAGAGHNPTLPVLVALDQETVSAAHAAAAAASAAGAIRVADPALAPDAWHLGEPVYDLRVAPETLEKIFAAQPSGLRTVTPVLVHRDTVGGGSHFLLTDGQPQPAGWATWSKAPEQGAVAMDTWAHGVFQIEAAPLLLAERGPPPGMLLH